MIQSKKDSRESETWDVSPGIALPCDEKSIGCDKHTQGYIHLEVGELMLFLEKGVDAPAKERRFAVDSG